ncbi:MAG: FIVAR domain-containing protein [Prevotella sp.]|nr:FIVAR domain-containing protein [Prevotella sp.]
MKTRHLLSVLVMLLFATSSAFAVDYYLVGDFNNWEKNDDYKLTLTNSEVPEYSITTTLAENATLKVISSENTWYPEGMGNDYVVSTAGTYTVYFRPNGNGNADWHYGVIYATIAATPSYSLTAEESEYGSVVFKVSDEEVTSAEENDEVTVVVTPKEGYDAEDITVKVYTSFDESQAPSLVGMETTVETQQVNETTWTFTMPANNVFVVVTYKEAEVPVDKTALQTALESADQVLDGIDKADYEEVDFTQFENAKTAAEAVLAKEDATQQEVDDAITALQNAITALNSAIDEENGHRFTKSIPSMGWATFISDNPVKCKTDAVYLYTITSIDVASGTISLSEPLSVLPANTPALIFNQSTAAEITLRWGADMTADEVTAAPEFMGTPFAATVVTADDMQANDYYVLRGENFVWVKDPGTIAGGKCYLKVAKTAAPAPSLSFVDGEGTTGIENIAQPSTLSNQPIYDLNGRRVAQPTKGLYIINGKKVILK